MNEKEMGSRWVERGTPKGTERDFRGKTKTETGLKEDVDADEEQKDWSQDRCPHLEVSAAVRGRCVGWMGEGGS